VRVARDRRWSQRGRRGASSAEENLLDVGVYMTKPSP
jgi:hypothetical protein